MLYTDYHCSCISQSTPQSTPPVIQHALPIIQHLLPPAVIFFYMYLYLFRLGLQMSDFTMPIY